MGSSFRKARVHKSFNPWKYPVHCPCYSPEVVAISANVVVVVSQYGGMLGVVQRSSPNGGEQSEGANGQDTDAGELHVQLDWILVETFQKVLAKFGFQCTLRQLSQLGTNE